MFVIKKLCKYFHSDHAALLNLSFTTEERPTIILGDDGCGKTTLLNILAGLEDYEGEVFYNGRSRKDIENKDIKISYITSPVTLFRHKSVYRNLEYVLKVEDKKIPKDVAREKIKSASVELGIVEFLNMSCRRLTNFQKILVCLARALIKNSTVLLIDEPFIGLTKYEIVTLWQAILLVQEKLSCDLIVSEKGQNEAYFTDCKLIKLEFGTQI